MRTFPLAMGLAAILTLLFSGCCSYVRIDTDLPPTSYIEGERPLAAFYTQNISYQFLGFLPFCSGVNWMDDDVPYEDANYWCIHFFCDEVSLDNNMMTLQRACKVVGSNRISSITHNINEDNLWSFLIFNRKVLKTSCFIMEPRSEANVVKKVP